MSEWKKVKIDFDTIKLGDFIEPIKTTVLELGEKNPIVYGVTNKEGIVQTGKPASKDISNYIALEDDCFAFNPYRVNVGSIGINDKKLKGCVSPAYVVFRTKNGLLPKFLYFYLKSDYGIHLINWYGNRGGVRNALRYSDLCNIDIPNINNLDQQRILERFLSASAKIDEIRKEIESQKNYIKQLRQNILQDATEGKLTADWRKQNPVKKGNPDYDAEALFEQIQKGEVSPSLQPASQFSATPSAGDTPATPPELSHGLSANALSANAASSRKSDGVSQRQIRVTNKKYEPITEKEKPFEIPEGWKWVRLGEISESCLGKMLDSAKNQGEKRKYLRNLNVRWFSFDLSDVLEMKIKDDELNRCSARKGDLLICEGGYPGRSAIWNEDYDICFQKAVHRVRFYGLPNMPRLFNLFLFLLSESGDIENYLTGEGIKHLTGIKLKQIKLPLPPLKEQEEIVNKVETLLAKVTTLENQIQDRKSLSDKLAFGIIKEKLGNC